MDKEQFKSMWEKMQREGYFSTHSHYLSDYNANLSENEIALDALISEIDYSQSLVEFPIDYSDEMERSVKRCEPKWLPEMFELPAAGRVLDIGCGYGRSLKWLTSVYDEAVGVDISTNAIDEARSFLKNNSNIRLYTSPADGIAREIQNESFNFIYAFTVFQHIPRHFTQRILHEAAQLLEPDGRIAFNLLTGINEDADSGINETEWAIGYSEAAVTELLDAAGLELMKLNKWCGPGTDVGWLWVLAGPGMRSE